MVPNLTDWTIVMVGQWNPAIFSPDWVARNLVHEDSIETQIAVGPIARNVRYQTTNLLVIPQQDRLIIGCRNVEAATLIEMERCARTALELLSHTPINAVGINFGFIENDPSAEILRTFDLADTGILGDAGYQVGATDITREIEIAPNLVLKLRMQLKDGRVHFHFNFTQQVRTAEEAAALLGGRVADYRGRAVGMLTAIFNLQGEGVA